MDISELKAQLQAEKKNLEETITHLVKQRGDVNAKIKRYRAEYAETTRLLRAAEGRKRRITD